jgi:hypothetical protein
LAAHAARAEALEQKLTTDNTDCTDFDGSGKRSLAANEEDLLRQVYTEKRRLSSWAANGREKARIEIKKTFIRVYS